MSKKNLSSNGISPNLKKLPLTEYFKRLPKAERRPIIISAPKEDLVNAIAEATQRNRHTVRCWLLGYAKPSSNIERQIIADLLKSDIDILFPKEA